MVIHALNSALRISDILKLKWEDVYDFEERRFRAHVSIIEQKTGKVKKFLLNKNVIEGLQRLLKGLEHI